jgi:hypothetical protein
MNGVVLGNGSSYLTQECYARVLYVQPIDTNKLYCVSAQVQILQYSQVCYKFGLWTWATLPLVRSMGCPILYFMDSTRKRFHRLTVVT